MSERKECSDPNKPVFVKNSNVAGGGYCRSRATPKQHIYGFWYEVYISPFEIEYDTKRIAAMNADDATKEFERWLFGTFIDKPNRYHVTTIDDKQIPIERRRTFEYKWNKDWHKYVFTFHFSTAAGPSSDTRVLMAPDERLAENAFNEWLDKHCSQKVTKYKLISVDNDYVQREYVILSS